MRYGRAVTRMFSWRAARLTVVAVSASALLLALLALSAPAATEPDRYVALGDSYSSGVGTGSYTLSSSCRRSTYAYPYLVARERENTSLEFVACSGATTTSLLSSQAQALTADTDIVTVTIGGNDIGFSSLIAQCTLSACASALDATRATLATFLGPRLDAAYAAIEQAAPDARVVVLGYPRLFSSASCLGTTGISSTERTKANQLADALDALTAARAAAAGFSYQSALGPFTGHAVCSRSAWINGLNLLSTIESYHPNRNGHALGYAPLVRAVVG